MTFSFEIKYEIQVRDLIVYITTYSPRSNRNLSASTIPRAHHFCAIKCYCYRKNLICVTMKYGIQYFIYQTLHSERKGTYSKDTEHTVRRLYTLYIVVANITIMYGGWCCRTSIVNPFNIIYKKVIWTHRLYTSIIAIAI